METKRISRPVMVVLAVIAAAGAAAWIYQTMFGLGVTGMNNSTSWGLYITCFMFFVGLSAGGLIVASSASVFHIAQFKKVAVPAIILSTVCICCAGMFVLIDLGGIQRIWNVLVSPNPMSPLLWDICVITCYLVINVLYLYFMTSKRANPHAVSIISRFALPIAILVHSVTAWIFGLQLAREAWYSAIMAPIFVASAMDSGLALLLIVLLAALTVTSFNAVKTRMSSDAWKRLQKTAYAFFGLTYVHLVLVLAPTVSSSGQKAAFSIAAYTAIMLVYVALRAATHLRAKRARPATP